MTIALMIPIEMRYKIKCLPNQLLINNKKAQNIKI